MAGEALRLADLLDEPHLPDPYRCILVLQAHVLFLR
jgi:hypothetical protein